MSAKRSGRTSKVTLGPWVHTGTEMIAGQWCNLYACGVLMAIVDGDGNHLSVSAPGRYPTWDEIAHARYGLLPADKTFALPLPPPDEYVNIIGGTRGGNIFHLWAFEYDSPEARMGRMLLRGLR